VSCENVIPIVISSTSGIYVYFTNRRRGRDMMLDVMRIIVRVIFIKHDDYVKYDVKTINC